MATHITHRGIKIVTLEKNEKILEHCAIDDIALIEDDAGWWIFFVDEDDKIEGYEAPFESYEKAVWTAKAAAEFAME